jgi:hypothetical protein
MAVKRKRKGTGMKGMTIGGGHKRPTKAGAGMTKKGVAKYRRQNPGSKLQTAVTESILKLLRILTQDLDKLEKDGSVRWLKAWHILLKMVHPIMVKFIKCQMGQYIVERHILKHPRR